MSTLQETGSSEETVDMPPGGLLFKSSCMYCEDSFSQQGWEQPLAELSYA